MLRVRGILLAALLAVSMAGCEAPPGPGQRALEAWVGVDVSALVVKTLDGEVQPLKDVHLFENDKAKPVVVNVWATWCTPCLAEMPTLDALGKSGRATVVAIATDKDAQTVKDFLKQQPWGSGVQVWHDPLGAATRAGLGAVALPSTYVLDGKLTVRMVAAGERDWASARMWNRIEESVR